MSILIGKVALVTGASRGIGAAFAERLAADGASVAITCTKDAGSSRSLRGRFRILVDHRGEPHGRRRHKRLKGI